MNLKEKLVVEINLFLVENEDLMPWTRSYTNEGKTKVYDGVVSIPEDITYEFVTTLNCSRNHLSQLPDRIEFNRKDYTITAMLESWKWLQNTVESLQVKYCLIIEEINELKRYYNTVSRVSKEQTS